MRFPKLTPFKSRTTGLVAWLLLIILVGPSLHGKLGSLWVMVSLTVIPFLGVYAVSNTRRDTLIGVGFGLPALVAMAIWVLRGDAIHEEARLSIVLSIFFGVYYVVTTVMILQHLFRQRRVTFDTLMGATAVYLLAGFSFAIAYTTISDHTSGAFNLPGAQTTFDFADALYYSFVTLTTLGYGDISPAAPLTRSLAIIESICGVLYLAIIISRFVAMYQGEEVEGEVEAAEGG